MLTACFSSVIQCSVLSQGRQPRHVPPPDFQSKITKKKKHPKPTFTGRFSHGPSGCQEMVSENGLKGATP